MHCWDSHTLAVLFHSALEEALDLPDFQRKNWFRVVEAARGYVPMFTDKHSDNDALSSECKLERQGLRKWPSANLM